jgi:tetratricopeptide (TPR) repeat protein
MWDDAVRSDKASFEASARRVTERGLTIAERDYHSLSWLQYEWLQQGRFSKTKEAIALVESAFAAAHSPAATPGQPASASPQHAGGHGYGEGSEIGRGSNDAALRNDRGSMRARYIIEGERWNEMKGQRTFDNIEELFALGLSAVNMGDAAQVRAVIAEFTKASAPSQPAELREQAGLMLREMQALDLFAQGQHAQAFAVLDQAVVMQNRMPKPIGRPMPVKDVNELYGELEMQLGRARQAATWFERALARTPNRSRPLLGLARAHRNAGDTVKARAAYKRFLTNYRLADAGLPEVAEARAALK